MLLGDEGLGRAKAQEKSPLVFQLLLLKTSPARLCGRPEPRHPAPPCPLSHEEPSPTAQQIWDVKRVGEVSSTPQPWGSPARMSSPAQASSKKTTPCVFCYPVWLLRAYNQGAQNPASPLIWRASLEWPPVPRQWMVLVGQGAPALPGGGWSW